MSNKKQDRKMQEMVNQPNKPLIESIINTSALTMTSYGVLQVTIGSPNFPMGYLAIGTGLFIEWFKYWGRKQLLW